jgi:hypothetical protein
LITGLWFVAMNILRKTHKCRISELSSPPGIYPSHPAYTNIGWIPPQALYAYARSAPFWSPNYQSAIYQCLPEYTSPLS